MRKVFLVMLLATAFIIGCGGWWWHVIKIGVIALFTGNYAQYGVAVNAFKKMVSQDKVNIVIGEVVSVTSQAISGLAQ